jgi:heme/copper-type cytochrome/quinol oxidase subunit 2
MILLSLLLWAIEPVVSEHPLALLRTRAAPKPRADNNPAITETGLSSVVLSILITIGVIVLIVAIAYIVYRYKRWKPRTKQIVRRSSAVTDETQRLVPTGIAVPVAAPVGATSSSSTLKVQ